MKNICVLGVLKTAKGLNIKKEMLSWLSPIYEVLCIEQDPPGVLFEYPAINYSIKTSLELQTPVLYLHTKGAANYQIYQTKVREIWKDLYGDLEKSNYYFEKLKINEPCVLCPFTGLNKATWFNGFIFNYETAKIIEKTIKTPDKCDRFYYEQKLFSDDKIKVEGILRNDCDNSKIMTNIIKGMV